jgi:hypothetical protein
MEVNTNFSTGGVGGIYPQKSPATAPTPAAAPDAFANSTALDEALQNLPAARPDAVARARDLIADPGYPSSGTLSQISSLLAGALTGDGE